MSAKESADQEVAANNATDDTPTEDQAAENLTEATWVIEGVESPLTPLQFHYLSLLQRLIALKNDYQTDPSYEKWMMDAINKSIGRFMLDGVLPAPRGVPQIEVAFDIDANGILSVSATDKGTGKEQKIVIQFGSGLADDEIERLINEAKTHEAEDQKKRAEVETRNQADSLVYTTEKLLEDNADKVPSELKEEVEGKITTLKAAVASENTAEMQTAMNDLNESMQRLGEAVYSQATPPGDAAPDGGPEEGPPPDDGESGGDTVEGEFREV